MTVGGRLYDKRLPFVVLLGSKEMLYDEDRLSLNDDAFGELPPSPSPTPCFFRTNLHPDFLWWLSCVVVRGSIHVFGREVGRGYVVK